MLAVNGFHVVQKSLKNLKKCKREKNLNTNVSLGENVVWYVTVRFFFKEKSRFSMEGGGIRLGRPLFRVYMT